MTTTTSATNAVVAQRVEISPGLIILRVVPDGWDLPDFEPGFSAALGQFIVLPDTKGGPLR